jgi:hypothetical protein
MKITNVQKVIILYRIMKEYMKELGYLFLFIFVIFVINTFVRDKVKVDMFTSQITTAWEHADYIITEGIEEKATELATYINMGIPSLNMRTEVRYILDNYGLLTDSTYCTKLLILTSDPMMIKIKNLISPSHDIPTSICEKISMYLTNFEEVTSFINQPVRSSSSNCERLKFILSARYISQLQAYTSQAPAATTPAAPTPAATTPAATTPPTQECSETYSISTGRRGKVTIHPKRNLGAVCSTPDNCCSDSCSNANAGDRGGGRICT